uniref:Ovule protein n=1 Tax=Schistosoma mansoni TaxID=6183 RepID=A0A5K4F3Q9_SCHMA
MSGNNSHIISQNNVKSEPSVSTCLPDRKTSLVINAIQNVLKSSHSPSNFWVFQSLGHSGPSVPTKLAYVDFRPWFKGWDQLDVSDQDKLKDLVIFNSTHQIDQYPNI